MPGTTKNKHMPGGQELKPQLKIQVKLFGIQATTLEQIDHAVKKSTTWPINHSEMMQMTNEKLQLVPGTLCRSHYD